MAVAVQIGSIWLYELSRGAPGDRCAALVATIGFPAPVVVPVVGTG
jgi:hypothetical protein